MNKDMLVWSIASIIFTIMGMWFGVATGIGTVVAECQHNGTYTVVHPALMPITITCKVEE